MSKDLTRVYYFSDKRLIVESFSPDETLENCSGGV
jgi:hypothetical protein